MAGTDAPITSPDQRKPSHPKVVRALVIVASLIFLSLLFGNHQGNIENLWLVGIAAAGFGWVIVDWVLHRNGLK
ncbi:MAG: DUF2631 domain-containing protein [Micromonosporaceae bacterium]